MEKFYLPVKKGSVNDVKIARLVNFVGKCDSNIEIIEQRRSHDVKNIKSMMELQNRFLQCKKLLFVVEGQDEQMVTNQLHQFFKC